MRLYFIFKIENIFEISGKILEINVTMNTFAKLHTFYVMYYRRLTENEPSCMLHMAWHNFDSKALFLHVLPNIFELCKSQKL